MKACIVGIQNIKHMTLISLYTNYFEKNGILYDLIYIDKYGLEEKNGANKTYRFDASAKIYNSVFGKLLKTVAFKKYACKIMNDNKYDFIVVWREQTASIFANYLKHKYQGKYCVNIRDLWNGKNIYITHGLKKAISYSAFNTISSYGFLDKLPQADYLMVHSLNPDFLNSVNNRSSNDYYRDPITISYIGTVRFVEYCYSLIDLFGNDSRFILKFVGQGSNVIKEYTLSKNINNVICVGQFEPDNTMALLEDANIINCAFGANSLPEQRLMPIRYYYALINHCPVLTTLGTWVDTEAKKVGIGISVPNKISPSKELVDRIYNDYYAIIKKGVDQPINLALDSISADNEKFIKAVERVFKES